jgi:hypothetical protein
MSSRVLPLLALILAVGAYFAYVNPNWSGAIAQSKAAIALDDQALTAANDYKSQQDTLAAARDAISPADLKRLSVFLPDSVDNVGLILDLNALAARSGLSLANIDAISDSGSVPAATAGSLSSINGNPTGSVNLSLSAVGTFTSFEAFLSGIERSARLLDVQDVVVGGSDNGVYTYTMSMRLYWLR